MRRRLQASSQNKKEKIISKQENEFNIRVEQAVAQRLELKEKEIARRVRMQATKEKQQFKESLQVEFESKQAALTSRLDAKIAEVAQLKSI